MNRIKPDRTGLFHFIQILSYFCLFQISFHTLSRFRVSKQVILGYSARKTVKILTNNRSSVWLFYHVTTWLNQMSGSLNYTQIDTLKDTKDAF